jgi:hypothetical protein
MATRATRNRFVGDADDELLDLRDNGLPCDDEPIPAGAHQGQNGHTKRRAYQVD